MRIAWQSTRSWGRRGALESDACRRERTDDRGAPSQTPRWQLVVDERVGMVHALPIMDLRLVVVLFCGSLLFVACGGSQKNAEHRDDKLVPEETQQRAGELQGRQDMMYDELGMTPAEQAAQRHDNATRPVENPKYGRDKKKER